MGGAERLRCAALLLCCAASSYAYYLPGTYPQEFYMGQHLQGARSPRRAPRGTAARPGADAQAAR
jgi:hypothetical protein